MSPNTEIKSPKHVAEIIAIIIAKATRSILTPEKSTPNNRLPTTNPQTDAHTAKRAGNTPLARIRAIFEQGDAIMERSLPKYLSLINTLPSPNMHAFVQSKKAFPITQFVRLEVLKLKVAIRQ
jgi:hypothetical protein